jgi:hypothetical protein
MSPRNIVDARSGASYEVLKRLGKVSFIISSHFTTFICLRLLTGSLANIDSAVFIAILKTTFRGLLRHAT